MQLLIPTKHLSIENSQLFKTAALIKILLKYQRIKFYDLYIEIKKSLKFISYSEFIIGLDILFILGKITYSKKNDVIEYIK